MASSDFVSDIYVGSGYVDNTYTEDTYVDAGYVSGIITGSANLTSSFTLTANAGDATDITQPLNLSVSATLSSAGERTRYGAVSVSGALAVGISANLTRRADTNLSATTSLTAAGLRTRDASADLLTSMGDTAWSKMGTWNNPTQSYWEGFVVTGEVVATASLRVTSSFTLTTDPIRIRYGATSVSSNATITTVGSTVPAIGSSNISANATVTVDAIRTRRGVSLEASLGTMSIDAVRTRNVNVNISSAMTFELDAFRTRNAATLQASLGSISVDGLRTRQGDVDLTSTTDFYANMVVPGQADITATASLTGSFGRIRANTEILSTSAFSIFARGGGLRLGRINISALASTLTLGSVYTIDPFRVYAVPTESRSLQIVEESRKKLVKSENRVNTVTDETRIKTINSETRQLNIQTLTLVNVSGQLLDIRE